LATSIDELLSELARRRAGSPGPDHDRQPPRSGGQSLFWAGALNLAVILTGSWLLGRESTVPSAHAVLLFCGAVISFVNVCWLLQRLGALQRGLALQQEALKTAERELAEERSRAREATW
jgi:hypothetical protein